MSASRAERTASTRWTHTAGVVSHRLAGRLPLAVLAGILGGLAAFWLRTIPIISDPWNYVHAGQTFPAEGSWNRVGLTRYGVIFPLVPVTRLFGESELSFILTPLLASSVLLGCSFWLAARFFGRVAGLATVLTLLACSPILTFASRTYPDIFSASSTVAAVAVAVAARDAGRGGRGGRRATLLLVATGLIVGLSWWMRETSVLSWPAVAAVLLWRGGPSWKRVVAWAGSAAAFMFALECVVSKLAFGDWMARFHALTGSSMAGTVNPQDMHYLDQGRLSYLETIPRVMLQQPDGQILLAEAGLAVLGLLFLRGGSRLFAAWFLATVTLLILAGGALNPANPSLRLDLVRYWLPFLVPMVIAAVGTVSVGVRAAGAAMAPWWRTTATRRTAAGMIALIGLVAMPAIPTAHYVRTNPEFVVTNGGVMNEFRTWISKHQEVKVLYADIATARQLPAFTRTFAGRSLAEVEFRMYRPERAGLPPAGSYVVLFSDRARFCGFCAEWIAELRSERPNQVRRWTKLWTSPSGAFKIYRVPADVNVPRPVVAPAPATAAS